jgi:prevent-host-death family protein
MASSRRKKRDQTVSASEARQQLAELVTRAYRDGTRTMIERSGIPVAAIVSAGDVQRLLADDERRTEALAAFTRISERFADVADDELDRQVDLAVQEVRREHSRSKPVRHRSRRSA